MTTFSDPDPICPRPLFETTARSVTTSTLDLITTSRQEIDDIVAGSTAQTATFESVLLPLAHTRNYIASKARILEFYKDVSADAALRQASRESTVLLDQFETEIGMREDLFCLVNAVAERVPTQELEPESQRLLSFEHRNFRKNGLAIPAGPLRDRFRYVKIRLSKVVNDFRKNMTEKSDSVVVFSQAELDGLPVDMLQRMKQCQGPEGNTGKLSVELDSYHYSVLLKYVNSGETRRRFLTAYDNRCQKNVPLFEEMVLLRDEAARLLGFTNHAQFRTQELMAKSPENVLDFLKDLQGQLDPVVQDELRILRHLKEQHLQEQHLQGQGPIFDGKFYIWDINFYHRQLLETRYSVDQEHIAEYLPVESVVPAMLGIFEEVFGLRFLKHSYEWSGRDNDLTWHQDVDLYDVWDQDGGFLGYMYLDLWARDNKYGNGYTKQDGTRQYPSTALVCNFTKLLGAPSLLRHSEVCLLFHELGHGIHDLVAKTIYSRFHGTAVADDFCEAPSQMLERWCWNTGVLQRLSRHYSTLSPAYLDHWIAKHPNKPLPRREMATSTIEALRRSENVNAALVNLRALWRSAFDMKVHAPTDRQSLLNMNFTHEFNALQADIMRLDTLDPDDSEWAHGQAQFLHMVTGYDAGYYGYLYSNVYAFDIFASAFEQDPLDPAVGKRYRHCILEKGGSQDEMTLLIRFLGRAPGTEAFARGLGLEALTKGT